MNFSRAETRFYIWTDSTYSFIHPPTWAFTKLTSVTQAAKSHGDTQQNKLRSLPSGSSEAGSRAPHCQLLLYYKYHRARDKPPIRLQQTSTNEVMRNNTVLAHSQCPKIYYLSYALFTDTLKAVLPKCGTKPRGPRVTRQNTAELVECFSLVLQRHRKFWHQSVFLHQLRCDCSLHKKSFISTVSPRLLSE